jgi:hypothetical protein
VDNKERSGEISGKISAAPNPISSGERCASLHGKPTIPAQEIRVATSAADEKLVTRGKNLDALRLI